MTELVTPDGRSLEMTVTGPGDGLPLLFFHGTPGSSPQDRVVQRAALAQGMRLVTWSRPGYGASTRAPGRTVADVAADATTVLSAIGGEECVVAGWSGGGPHALACAALLPDRVRGALVIAGVAPRDAEGLDWMAGMGEENVEEFGAALAGEAPLRAYLDAARPELVTITAEDIVSSMTSLLPPVDVEALTGEFAEDVAASFRHAVSTGVDGWLDDDLAFVAPWGFEPADVKRPVLLWQGSEDLMVPFAHGRWLAERLPHVTAHLEDGEGHLSIGVGAMDRMVAELAVLAAG